LPNPALIAIVALSVGCKKSEQAPIGPQTFAPSDSARAKRSTSPQEQETVMR